MIAGNQKLSFLARETGFPTVLDMLESVSFDSIVPGVCTDPDCWGWTENIEPDAREGYCEECGKNTIESCLSLAGVI